MGASTYYNKLRSIFQGLGYNVSHIRHSERAVGPVLLEFDDVLSSFIKDLVLWEQGIFDRLTDRASHAIFSKKFHSERKNPSIQRKV